MAFSVYFFIGRRNPWGSEREERVIRTSEITNGKSRYAVQYYFFVQIYGGHPLAVILGPCGSLVTEIIFFVCTIHRGVGALKYFGVGFPRFWLVLPQEMMCILTETPIH